MDFGAIENYISSGYIRKYYIEICEKEKPYKLALADGSLAG
jgi:hypothetical protein